MKFNLFRRARRQDETGETFFHDEAFVIMDENSMHEQKGWSPDKETNQPKARRKAAKKQSAPKKSAAPASKAKKK